MYLTYEEYSDMGGTLDEAAFTDLEFEARAYVDWVTFSRLKNEDEEAIPKEVKECMYHILKLIQTKLEALNTPVTSSTDGSTVSGGVGILSQSNDGVSISYNVITAKEILDNSEKELTRCIQRYLQGVRNSLGQRLLFRGLYPNE